MLDLDELEAKAKAAGPAWVKDGPWAETCVRPAEVLALIRELREARAAVAAEREACAAQVQGWNTAMTDKLATEVERLRGCLEYARDYVDSLVENGEAAHAVGLLLDIDGFLSGPSPAPVANEACGAPGGPVL